MEKRRVVITGLGTVNPLGNTVAESWAAAKAGQCGIAPITQFDTAGFKCKLAAEVKGFDPETIVDKKEARKMARFTVLALAAAAEAVADSGLDTEAEAKQIGVILSSGIGGLPTIEEQHTRGEEKGMEKVSPYFVPMSIANMAAAQVAIRFGLKGMCTCPVTACAGGTNAVGDAFHRIRDGYEDAMVCEYDIIAESVTLTAEDYVVVMTNGHSGDLIIEEQVLRSPHAYLGVVGSRSKIAFVNKTLMDRGIPEEALKAVHTPIGTPIRAVTPAEIAVSILGELILCRAEIREGEMPAHHGCPMHG